MKKVLFLIFALAMTCGSALAFPISFGVKAGLDFSRFSGADVNALAQNASSSPSAELKSKVGFAGGAFLGVGVGGSWAIQPEFLYVMKGTKVDAAQGGGNINLNYFEIPVLLKLNLLPAKSAVNPFVFAGPSLSFKTGTKFTSKDVDQNYQARSADYGLVLGTGLDIQKFSLDVRYDLGFQNPIKAPQGKYTPSVHNGTVLVLVGYRFF
jgi:hypothetical protein